MKTPMDEAPARTLLLPWIILSLLLVGGAAVAVYKTWPLLHPPLARIANSNRGCDLRSVPCTARFPDGGSVSLAIEPRPIPVVTPLRLGVEISGLDAHAVEVDFAGVDMNMGFNRVSLQEHQAGRYEGQGMLPVCVRSRMTWEARVLIHTPQGILAAPFRFETGR